MNELLIPISNQEFNSMVNIRFKNILDGFNLFKNFSFYVPTMRFHNLRDTYATLMLKNGCNIFTLKKLLGHSSFSSTSRYIKYDISDLAQAPVLSSLMEIE